MTNSETSKPSKHSKPTKPQQQHRHVSPKRLRPSIKRDRIHPSDYLNYINPLACEDCTHYSSENRLCSIGYIPTPHLRETQEKSYFLTGTMALCRFMEID